MSDRDWVGCWTINRISACGQIAARIVVSDAVRTGGAAGAAV